MLHSLSTAVNLCNVLVLIYVCFYSLPSMYRHKSLKKLHMPYVCMK